MSLFGLPSSKCKEVNTKRAPLNFMRENLITIMHNTDDSNNNLSINTDIVRFVFSSHLFFIEIDHQKFTNKSNLFIQSNLCDAKTCAQKTKQNKTNDEIDRDEKKEKKDTQRLPSRAYYCVTQHLNASHIEGNETAINVMGTQFASSQIQQDMCIYRQRPSKQLQPYFVLRTPLLSIKNITANNKRTNYYFAHWIECKWNLTEKKNETTCNRLCLDVEHARQVDHISFEYLKLKQKQTQTGKWHERNTLEQRTIIIISACFRPKHEQISSSCNLRLATWILFLNITSGAFSDHFR